jgi:hypothetical protein
LALLALSGLWIAWLSQMLQERPKRIWPLIPVGLLILAFATFQAGPWLQRNVMTDPQATLTEHSDMARGNSPPGNRTWQSWFSMEVILGSTVILLTLTGVGYIFIRLFQ